MTNAARGGFPVDELGVAAVALDPVLAALTLQPYGYDVPVVVPVLHGWVLRNDDGAHRWLASSPPPGCQRGLPLSGRDASMPRMSGSNRLARRRALTSSSTPTIPWTGFPGATRRSTGPGQEDKPIFLSIGYSACHWCHVMERESFENEEIAKLMNEHFVAIKVDREERPDVDHIYMAAVQLMIGRGGWPLTVFLTPDAGPSSAGTYFPRRTGTAAGRFHGPQARRAGRGRDKRGGR